MLCTHYLTESLQRGRKYIIIPFHPGGNKLGEARSLPQATHPGSFEPQCAPGSLTPHHAICHFQTLLICSNAFLQLLARLNSFSMYLLTTCISSSVHFLHVAAFLMLTWHQQARGSAPTKQAYAQGWMLDKLLL